MTRPFALKGNELWVNTKPDYEKVPQKNLSDHFEFFPEYKFKHSTWYDYVDANCATEVKHRVIYNSPVNEIDYSGEKVIVKTKNGKLYAADKVFVTISIGVLKANHITFIPDLSDKKKKKLMQLIFFPV